MKRPGVIALLASGLVHALVLSLIAPGLPDRVPIHFGGSGGADDWTSRSGALWTFALIGGGLLALFLALVLLAPRLPMSIVNLPPAAKEWWSASPERTAELRRRIGTDLGLAGAATVLLISVTALDTARAAQQSEPALGWLFFGSLALYLLLMLGWCVLALTSRYRPEDP